MRHTDEHSVGTRLAHIRAHTSQRAFAEQLCVPLRTYQTYERGERDPDGRTMSALSARGWNLHWLLTGDGPERVNESQPLAVAESSHAYGSQVQPQAIDSEIWHTALSVTAFAANWLDKEPGRDAYANAVAHMYELLAGGGAKTLAADQLVATATAALQRPLKGP